MYRILSSISSRKNQSVSSGFTLAELLIVIVVIAILAAISLVAYNGIQDKARLAALQSDMQSAATKLEIYKSANDDNYPGSVTDCPTPASTNICLTPSAGDSYIYTAIPANNAPGYIMVNAASYQLTIENQQQFLYSSPAEKHGSTEFMQYVDLAPIMDKYGLVKYQLSFDIKSSDTSSKNIVNIYFQNGSSARYGGLSQNVPVTTAYTH